MDHTALTIATKCADAVSAQDFATLSSLFADDIVWHQPGSHRFSGTHGGARPFPELVAATKSTAGGTLKLTLLAA